MNTFLELIHNFQEACFVIGSAETEGWSTLRVIISCCTPESSPLCISTGFQFGWLVYLRFSLDAGTDDDNSSPGHHYRLGPGRQAGGGSKPYGNARGGGPDYGSHLRQLQLDAYTAVMRAFRAQKDHIDWASGLLVACSASASAFAGRLSKFSVGVQCSDVRRTRAFKPVRLWWQSRRANSM
jgi:hypothetical protein